MKKGVKSKKSGNLLSRASSSRKVLALGAVAILAVVGFAIFSQGRTNAHAYGGNEWCARNFYGALGCLNAWDGGPSIKIYTHTGAANNYFELQQDHTGNSYFKFRGPGVGSGLCIGDVNNSPYQKHLGYLDLCGSGWGTYFTVWQACDNYTGWTFKNNHSGKFLSLAGFTNGASVYLDSDIQTCWHPYQ